MLGFILSIIDLFFLNKRLLFVAAVLVIVVFTIAMFAVSPEVVLAGPATSNSACGTCGG